MDRELMLHALGLLFRLRRPAYRFSLSGGEVTLYPYLDEMLAAIAQQERGTRCVINLLSNGSASARRMRSLLDSAPDAKIRFIITVHLGQTRVSDLVEKLLTFTREERQRHFHVKIVTPPVNKEAYDAFKQLSDAGIGGISMRPVIDFGAGKLKDGYSDEDLQNITSPKGRKEFFQFTHVGSREAHEVSFTQGIRQDFFHYQGMLCGAGYQSIYLDELGMVSKGQFCGAMGYSIGDKNPFEDPAFIKPWRCAEPHCTCVPFTSLPKWSTPEHAPDYLKNHVCGQSNAV